MPYLAVDWTHSPDDWLRAVGKDGLVISRIISRISGEERQKVNKPVFPSERLSVGQHGELVDHGRVQQLHVVRPWLDPAESDDDDGDGEDDDVSSFTQLPIRTGSSLASTLTLGVQIIVVRIAFPRPDNDQLSSISSSEISQTYSWSIQATVTSPPTILGEK